jgi:hypothetical protein
MSKDLGLPTSPRALNSHEKRIFAHEQVGDLAPFTPEILVLKFESRWDEEHLTDAVERVLTEHPAFTARFETHPGGDVIRHSDRETKLVLCGFGDVAMAQNTAQAHRPSHEDTRAFADFWSAADGGYILALTLHPILADDGVYASIERAIWHALDTDQPGQSVPEAEKPQIDRKTRAQRLNTWRCPGAASI